MLYSMQRYSRNYVDNYADGNNTLPMSSAAVAFLRHPACIFYKKHPRATPKATILAPYYVHHSRLTSSSVRSFYSNDSTGRAASNHTRALLFIATGDSCHTAYALRIRFIVEITPKTIILVLYCVSPLPDPRHPYVNKHLQTTPKAIILSPYCI